MGLYTLLYTAHETFFYHAMLKFPFALGLSCPVSRGIHKGKRKPVSSLQRQFIETRAFVWSELGPSSQPQLDALHALPVAVVPSVSSSWRCLKE